MHKPLMGAAILLLISSVRLRARTKVLYKLQTSIQGSNCIARVVGTTESGTCGEGAWRRCPSPAMGCGKFLTFASKFIALSCVHLDYAKWL